MDIRTVTYTPTSSRGGRKHLPGEGGRDLRSDGGGGTSSSAGTGTPRLSGYHSGGSGGGGGAGGEGDVNITLKLWDFGGTEEFHAVHGLFFSG